MEISIEDTFEMNDTQKENNLNQKYRKTVYFYNEDIINLIMKINIIIII